MTELRENWEVSSYIMGGMWNTFFSRYLGHHITRSLWNVIKHIGFLALYCWVLCTWVILIIGFQVNFPDISLHFHIKKCNMKHFRWVEVLWRHSRKNGSNLFQITADAHPGVSWVSKDQKFCEKLKKYSLPGQPSSQNWVKSKKKMHLNVLCHFGLGLMPSGSPVASDPTKIWI